MSSMPADQLSPEEADAWDAAVAAQKKLAEARLLAEESYAAIEALLMERDPESMSTTAFILTGATKLAVDKAVQKERRRCLWIVDQVESELECDGPTCEAIRRQIVNG